MRKVKHFYAKNGCFLNGSQIKRILLKQNYFGRKIYILYIVNELAIYKTMFIILIEFQVISDNVF